MKKAIITAVLIIGILWACFNTLIGLLLLPFYGPHGSVEFRNWTVIVPVRRAIGNPGAQTWGNLIFVVGTQPLSDRLFRHERAHVKQSMFLGPLFLIAYGAEFLIRLASHPNLGWRHAYFNLSWEKAARDAELE